MTSADQIAAEVAAQHGVSIKTAKQIFDSFMGSISGHVSIGTEVNIAGFGKFAKKRTAERPGRNLKTGEPITIGAKNKVTFKPAKALRDALNN